MKVNQSAMLKILLLAAAAFYTVFILRTSFRIREELFFTLVDDAMVSMRYAKHLAEGNGMVWNIGAPPIQGFTNPGWMLLMTLVHLIPLGASKTSLVVMITSALILLANTLVVYKICLAIDPDSKYAPVIASGICAFYFPLVFWSLRGMEVGILVLLVDLAVLLAVNLSRSDRLRTTIFLGLMLLLTLAVRMDAILQVFVLIVFVIQSRRASSNRILILIGIVVLTLVAIATLQKLYFGDYLPNTYYQKVVGASALDRIQNGLLLFNRHATRDTMLLMVLSVAGVMMYSEMRGRETILLAVLFLVQCGYSVWVGGDYAEPEVDAANRFITQGMPALIILFSLAADHVISDILTARSPAFKSDLGIHTGILAGVVLGVLLIISGKPWVSWVIDNAPLLKADIRRVRIGISIAKYTSSDSTIAVHAAGQIPYYSNRTTLDLLGLNDAVIAKGPVTGPLYPGHDKWNYDYSIKQLKPDLIADNWTKLGDFMTFQKEYEKLDNGMYVRRGTTLVNTSGLTHPDP